MLSSEGSVRSQKTRLWEIQLSYKPELSAEMSSRESQETVLWGQKRQSHQKCIMDEVALAGPWKQKH
jgi:hypothetical protein